MRWEIFGVGSSGRKKLEIMPARRKRKTNFCISSAFLTQSKSLTTTTNLWEKDPASMNSKISIVRPNSLKESVRSRRVCPNWQNSSPRKKIDCSRSYSRKNYDFLFFVTIWISVWKIHQTFLQFLQPLEKISEGWAACQSFPKRNEQLPLQMVDSCGVFEKKFIVFTGKVNNFGQFISFFKFLHHKFNLFSKILREN